MRSHTLGISVGCSLCVEPGPGIFNQIALQHIDYAIETARIHHIRLIIPLTDNWHYYHGGKHTFTNWQGVQNEQQFYTNSVVIARFKQYISVLLNHVNSYTGIAYKNDPTILVWETGNELSAPVGWVQSIASYLKSIDLHHLVMDGNYEQANELSNFVRDLNIKAVDMSITFVTGKGRAASSASCGSWSLVPNPNTGMFDTFNGVAAVDATPVWAVGYYYTSGGNGQTLIERWNGTAWNIVPSPNPGSSDNGLYGIARIPGTNHVWTVGRMLNPNTSYAYQTLIELWNGTTWSTDIALFLCFALTSSIGALVVMWVTSLKQVGSQLMN